MPTSLKSCLPVLARALGTTPDALYERQRTIVREGLLESTPGRGPGSGVRATAESIALLLIAEFARAGEIYGTGPVTREIATAVARGGKCPLTGMPSFQSALAQVLSDETVSRRVSEIKINVTQGIAEISFNNKGQHGQSVFSPVPKPKNAAWHIDVAFNAGSIRNFTKATIGILKDAT